MNKKITEKDKKDWQEFLDRKDSLEIKDEKIFKENFNILERSIDLHGCTLDEANEVITRFIKNSSKDKVTKIKVITGKGLRSKNLDNPYVSNNLGILKYSVPNYIKNNSNLMRLIKEIDFKQVEDLNSGSFLIFLKKL
ncbi:MAG: Smr/MutS family protein [Candidatus Pelagibacter sp.]